MHRLDSTTSEQSEDAFLAFGEGYAAPQADLPSGPIRSTQEPPRQQAPSGPPSLKRRRARDVKRSLNSLFDSVEGVGTVVTPHPVQSLAAGQVSHGGGNPGGVVGPANNKHSNNDTPRDHNNGKRLGVSSDDLSNGSVLTVENQLSTSQIVDSRGRLDSRRKSNKRAEHRHQYVSLLELLTETDRGSRLSLSEVKALVYSLAEDLGEVHEGRMLHTSTCLESAVLEIVDGAGRASLMVVPSSLSSSSSSVLTGSASASLASRSFVWPAADVLAGRAPVCVHPHTMPPEMAHCRQDAVHRVLTSKGNIWSLGCIMFALLAGGRDPFGAQGVGVCGGETMLLSLDRQQAWLSAHVLDAMRAINENKSFGKEGRHGEDARKTGKRVFCAVDGVVGFDDLAWDLLSRLLRADPGQRLTAKSVLSHPWFDGVRQCLPQRRRGVGEERKETPSTTMSTERSLSDDQDEQQLLSYRSDLKYSELHQRYIFIDPSILSPMHPYTLVGHVKKEITFESLGETYGGIGVYAVYDVPHHGTMMSAKPIKVNPH